MSEPVWLDEPAVHELHDLGIAEFGGPQGVRDPGLLSSALQRAPNRWAYESVEDVHDLATTYAVAISGNHPFIDGNKRAAFLAMVLFLRRNGRTLLVSSEEATEVMLKVAAGSLTLQDMAQWVRGHSGPFPS